MDTKSDRPTSPGTYGVPRVRSFARTDIGRHRRTNQDAYLTDDALKLWVVADGMGGHAAGEVASAEAVDTVHGMVKRGLETLGAEVTGGLALGEEHARAACRVVEGAIQAATYMVFAIAEHDRQKSGMGTTITAAIAVADSLVVGQVGDSRVYRVRDSHVEQLTEDHTLIAWQIKKGILSEEEAKISPYRNVITRAVGSRDYVEVDTSVHKLEPGDRYLLCSDGLHGYFDPEDLGELIEMGGQDAVDALIDMANARGGRDNITAVLVEVTEPVVP